MNQVIDTKFFQGQDSGSKIASQDFRISVLNEFSLVTGLSVKPETESLNWKTKKQNLDGRMQMF